MDNASIVRGYANIIKEIGKDWSPEVFPNVDPLARAMFFVTSFRKQETLVGRKAASTLLIDPSDVSAILHLWLRVALLMVEPDVDLIVKGSQGVFLSTAADAMKCLEALDKDTPNKSAAYTLRVQQLRDLLVPHLSKVEAQQSKKGSTERRTQPVDENVGIDQVDSPAESPMDTDLPELPSPVPAPPPTTIAEDGDSSEPDVPELPRPVPAPPPMTLASPPMDVSTHHESPETDPGLSVQTPHAMEPAAMEANVPIAQADNSMDM